MAGWSEDDPSSTPKEDVIDGFGMTIGAARNVARRQLIGSIVALCLIAAFAIVAGLRSSQFVAPPNPEHSARAVQGPSYAVPQDRIVAAKQGCFFEGSLATP